MKANRWAIINAGGIRESGTDELQSDVMSFMAILGFCLMAIFAIVQSLPLSSADNRPQLETRTRLSDDIQALEQHLVVLKQQTGQQQQKIRELQRQEQQLAGQIGLYSRTLDQRTAALSEAERHLQAVSGRISKQQQRLQRVNAELWEGREALGTLRRRVRIETRILNEQADELARLQQQTRELTAPPKVTEPISAPHSDPIAAAETKTETAISNSPKPSPEGFSLRFDSDSALLQLLARRTIQLYAMISNRVWAFSPQPAEATAGPGDSAPGQQNLRFQLIEATKPGLFYEMTAGTVPGLLTRQVLRDHAIFDPARVTWAVVLPGSIRTQINNMLRRHDSGTLVIGAQGQVQHEGS